MNVSSAYLIGLIAGLVAVAAAFTIMGAKKGRSAPYRYDERQTLARLKAYRAAFFTLIAYLLINELVKSLLDMRWGEALVEPFIGICAALTLFVILCVFSDAYFALNEKRPFYMKLFAAAIVVNAVPIVMNIADGEGFTTNGLVNFHVMNIVILVMFALIIASLAVKAALDRRTKAE